jgi:predicted esterase
MEERFIRVHRTARFHVLGSPASARELWIVVHGYGQLARYFLNQFDGLSPDLCIVAPEGLSRFYLDAGHTRVGATWMTREDRLHEIDDHVAYLDQMTRELQQQAPPGTLVNVLGFSQGVATASRWALRGLTRFDRMVLWAGNLPPELDRDTLQALRGSVVDLVLGDQDEFMDRETLLGAAQRLEAAGVDHRHHIYRGGHKLDALTLQRLLDPR